MLSHLALIVFAYLVGSVASAVIVCRLMGLPDPRSGGSGNPGATNVLRLGGKKAAAVTLAGDLLKGLAPVLVTRLFTDSATVLTAAGVAAFLGHLFPVFFRFQGGKGVATTFGVVAGLSFEVALAMAITWGLVAYATRFSSLAALTAAVLAPVYAVWLAPDRAFVAGLCVIGTFLLWRHRDNIKRLLSGTESKIGESTPGVS